MATLTATTLAHRMTRARLFVGIEQQEIAELLGKNRSTISAWERGLNEPPISAVAQWAQLTGRSIDWLVWGDDGRPEYVRPEGFEPPTYWSVASCTLCERLECSPATHERCPCWCHVNMDGCWSLDDEHALRLVMDAAVAL